jgi:hypothetical protein
MSRKPAGNTAVTDIVNRLAEEARKSRADGPSSSLHGSRAALSTTINQAGTLLATIDRDEPPRRSSLLQTVLGMSSSAPAPAPRKRGWFFTRADAAPALTSGRIDKLLKASAKDGTRLSLEAAVEKATEGDLQCVLPEGASDPVCEPRRS